MCYPAKKIVKLLLDLVSTDIHWMENHHEKSANF